MMTLAEFDASIKSVNTYIEALRGLRLRIAAMGRKKPWPSMLKTVDARIAEADAEREHLFKLPAVEGDPRGRGAKAAAVPPEPSERRCE
jgi:hypothetical protein